MKSVALHNLGCKVNSYEIEVMQQMLQEKGYTIVPFDETADIYIVNTCTVTNIADRKSRQMLHRAKQKNPAALVVAVGCYVQTGREDVEQDPLHRSGDRQQPQEGSGIYFGRIFTGSGTGRCGGGECRKCRAWCGQDSA